MNYFKPLAIAVLLLASCTTSKQKLVCVYSTQDDEWGQQMLKEMMFEAATYPDVRIEFRTKQPGDGTGEEMDAIEYFLSQKPNAIILVTNNFYLRNHITQTMDQGIPVVLLCNSDPKVNYTVRITNDDKKTGRDAAHYIADRMHGHGRVLELAGYGVSGNDRMAGFHSVIDSFPDIEVTATLDCGFNRQQAYTKTSQFLAQEEEGIDVVFAHNDRMAIGAAEAFAAQGRRREWRTFFYGIDALMNDSVGIGRLEDGTIDISMLCPTGGREAIREAMNVIYGRPYERDVRLYTQFVTKDSIPRLRSSWREKVARYQQQVSSQAQEEMRQKRYSRQEVLLCVAVAMTVLMTVLTAWLMWRLRYYNNKVRELMEENRQMSSENDTLGQEKTKLEVERDVLTAQRDRWFDLRSLPSTPTEQTPPSAEPASFRSRLLALIRQHMEDEDFNVEMLSGKMGMSRVQLTRRVKAEFEMSPGDLLRNTRMEHAMHLLKSTELTVSEVAYHVGYSNGKYFAKSFKEHFQITPSSVKRQ